MLQGYLSFMRCNLFLSIFSVAGWLGVSVNQVQAYTTSTSYSVHLISLPDLPTSTSSLVSVPQSVRDLWRWKDSALGNGQDFFVPRPRALKSLISQLLGQTFFHPASNNDNSVCWSIDECAILSNCARMEIYLVCTQSTIVTTTEDHNATMMNYYTSPKAVIAAILASQLEHYKSSNNEHPHISFITTSLSEILDLPGSIPTDNLPIPPQHMVREIQENLQEIIGIEPITRHLCLVSCGMAPRPNRPNRPVHFRPFSSRDAHILLQLKRTLDVAVGHRIQRILQSSLSAGKAARDVRVVPQLRPLLRNGDCRTAQATAVAAAMELVIEPEVKRSKSSLYASERSFEIQQLRQRCEAYVIQAKGDLNNTEGRALRKLLHAPTVALREGKDISEDDVLKSVEKMLSEARPGSRYLSSHDNHY